jgi:hypothetical protein
MGGNCAAVKFGYGLHMLAGGTVYRGSLIASLLAYGYINSVQKEAPARRLTQQALEFATENLSGLIW